MKLSEIWYLAAKTEETSVEVIRKRLESLSSPKESDLFIWRAEAINEILSLLKTDRMALAKRVAEELTSYRRGSRGLTAHERALAYDQLGHFMKRLKRGEIWSELESKSEEGVK